MHVGNLAHGTLGDVMALQAMWLHSDAIDKSGWYRVYQMFNVNLFY